MNFKNNSIKKIFIVSLMMIALSISILFTCSLKNKSDEIDEIETEISKVEKFESSLSLGWNEEQRIQMMSTNSTVTTTNGLEYDPAYWEIPDDLKIVGGMEIKFSNNAVVFKDATKSYTAKIKVPAGYRITEVDLGNKETVEIWKSVYDYGTIYDENRSSVKNYYDADNDGITDEDYVDDAESITTTPEELDEHYIGVLNFKVVVEPVVYKLTMYYDSDLTDYVDDLNKTMIVDFTVIEASSLPNLTDKTANKEFGAWVLKDTPNDDIALEEESGGVVTVAGDSGKWLFTYSEKYDGTQTFEENDDDTIYYYVTSITGYGNFNKNTIGDKNVFAKWTNIYDAVIDNSTNNWVGNTDLAGAYSNKDTNSDPCIATIQIKEDTTNSKGQKFFSNVGSAFGATGKGLAKPTAVSAYNSVYYVYNYGYEITGWEIKCSNGYYLEYDTTNKQWILESTDCVNLIENLGTTSSDAVASYLDEVANYVDIGFINGCPPSDFEITMKPIWETTGVNIKMSYSHEEDGSLIYLNETSIIYGSINKYNLEKVDVINGKSLIYYQTAMAGSTGSIIALSGRWNYTNLSQAAFMYYRGIYVLPVSTCTVDNIYKITLSGVKPISAGTYKITNTDYEFSGSKDYENPPTPGFYTFENCPGCEFKTYDNYGVIKIEEYIKNFLVQFYQTYTSGIAGDFEILRKVFAVDGSLDTADITNKTFNSSATDPGFYIFLANGQETGDLPTIDTNNYELIIWEWDETDANNLAFKTSNYDDESHESAMAGLLETETYVENKVWNLLDTWDNSKALNINLLAHYFRKYYYLDVETLLDSDEDRFGYVLIDVVDNEEGAEESGKYLAIYDNRDEENGGIQDILIYELDLGAELSSFTLIDTSISKTLINQLKIFAGCDLTIYVKDQSQDTNAMASGDYDDMIGYRFKELTSQVGEEKGGLFANSAITDYIKELDSSALDNLGLKSGTIISIKAHFEKIQYSLKVTVDSAAGSFTITRSGATSISRTEYTIENLEVDEILQITYIANVGYEFSADAFKLVLESGHEKTLIEYDDLIEGNRIKAQYYVFTLNGEWLRVNYYSEYEDYSREDTNIGTIQIGTQGIPFNYGIKLYDSTVAGDGIIYEYIKIDIEEDDSLQMRAGIMTLPSVGEEMVEISDGSSIWIIRVEDVKNYALLNSRLYFPANMLTTESNYFTEYNFLLTEKLTQKFSIDSRILSHMCDCGTGDIVPFDSREIHMLLEVRELLSITMSVKEDSTDGLDSNSTERSTTIKNANHNSVDIITQYGTAVDGYYTIQDSETVYEIVAYSYNGLSNNISSKYDEKRYSGVEYFRNAETTAMTETDFTLNSDASIQIRYIPKALSLSWKFFVDGEEKTTSEMVEDNYLDVIESLSSSIDSAYKINDEITFAYRILDLDYVASVSINGATYEPSYYNGTYSLSYIAQDLDYDSEGINIEVNLTKKPNSDITIKYALIDNSKSLPDDDYGTFGVKIGDGEYLYGNNFNVIAGKSVKVDISGLNSGYEFSGEIYHNNMSVDVVIDGLIITLTDSYNPGDANNDADSGTYVIYINKVNVVATLNKRSGLSDWSSYYQIKDGTISSTLSGDKTKSTLNNLYVGKEITLWHKEVNEERLVSFYYIGQSGPVYIENTLKITSDLLNLFNNNGEFDIQINFEIINRYQISVKITEGVDYVASWELTKVEDTSLVQSGTYFDEGTEINLKLDTLLEGKYKIVVVHNVSEPELEASYSKFDLTYTLNQNVIIKILVQKETFVVNVSENIYASLEDLSGNPQEVEDEECVNGINVESSIYESDVTLNVVRVREDDRRLKTITLSGNDMIGLIKIEFVDAKFKIFYQETEEAEFEEISSERLTELGFKLTHKEIYGVACVSLNYTALNIVNITCDYIDFKIITAE